MRLLATLLLLLVLAGCGTAPSGHVTAPSPVPDPVPEPDPEVRLALVGDVLLTPATTYRGADWPWNQVAPTLKGADLAMANLETAVSLRGKPSADKQFTFRSHPSTMQGAARAGIDLFSLANNHTLDFGPEALLDTIGNVTTAGIHPVGAGNDTKEAYAPALFEVNGLKLAVVALTRVIPFAHWAAGENHTGLAAGWDPKVATRAVQEAKAQADVVVVLVHWGEEVKENPRSSDIDLAQQLLDAGATVIAGHHPHILQGIQRKGAGLVAYSLGNFIFPPVSRPLNQETGILEVTVGRDGVREATFTPMLIVGGQPRPPEAALGARILERLDRLSAKWQTSVSPSGAILPRR